MSGYSHALPRLRIKRPSPPGWSTWWKGMIALMLFQAGHLVFVTHTDSLDVIFMALVLVFITFALFFFKQAHDMWRRLEDEGQARPVPGFAWALQASLWAWTVFVYALL